jgi:putative IMPACT (imprinted ancient) family translation regulator
VRKVEVDVELEYTHVDALRRLLPACEAELLTEDYGARVRYRLALPASRLEELRTALRNLTHGAARLTLHEPEG